MRPTIRPGTRRLTRPEQPTGPPPRIQSYGGGGFRITEKFLEGSILLVAGRVMAWPVTSFAAVTYETLAPVSAAANDVEILLIGAGPGFALVTPDLREKFRADGIAVEAMDTGAACRTYNVLLAEGRQIAAALIAVD